jgi:hypothetical protein
MSCIRKNVAGAICVAYTARTSQFARKAFEKGLEYGATALSTTANRTDSEVQLHYIIE